MNRLTTEKRAQIIGCLVEGNSMRATVRMTGAAKNTITKLLVDLGAACADYQDGVLADLPCKVVEADEIWSYCYAKQKNVPEAVQGHAGLRRRVGPSRRSRRHEAHPVVAGRRADHRGLRSLPRRPGEPDANRIQLSTDGLGSYEGPVWTRCGRPERSTGRRSTRTTAAPRPRARKYSRGLHGSEEAVPLGRPDPDEGQHSLRRAPEPDDADGHARLPRLTNGFTKKVENHAHAVSLHFMHYNFARRTRTLDRCPGRRPWRRGWPITCGGWRRSRRCSTGMEVEIGDISTVLAVHAGEGTLAVLWFDK